MIKNACKTMKNKNPPSNTLIQIRCCRFFKFSEPLFIIIYIPLKKNTPPTIYK